MKKIFVIKGILGMLVACLGTSAMAQTSGNWDELQKGDRYYDSKDNVRMDTMEIRHRPGKWYDLFETVKDVGNSFSKDTPMFDALLSVTEKIQATHTYIDTIYVHKGTTVELELPDMTNNGGSVFSSVKGYQRWYSYRTGKTFSLPQSDPGGITDLLTPYVRYNNEGREAYRLKNGYVGHPLCSDGKVLNRMRFYYPTDEEFNRWIGDGVSGVDNKWYVVACDVSGYGDYYTMADGKANKGKFAEAGRVSYEPTLSHRVLFYLCAVDTPAADNNYCNSLLDKDFHDGLGEDFTVLEGKKWVEVYNINYPAVRLSDYTHELVVLSKDAEAFRLPGVFGEDDYDGVEVVLADNTAGICLVERFGGNNYNKCGDTLKLRGKKRVISFEYPQKRPDGTQTVDNADNGARATILVVKKVGGTVYNLARYNLTFTVGTQLMSQTMIRMVEKGDAEAEKHDWGGYYFRTEKFFVDNGYKLVGKLDFNYPKLEREAGYDASFYPFPVGWEYSCYGFYDGDRQYITNNKGRLEWSHYGLLDDYIEVKYGWGAQPPTEKLAGSTYHMYVDASDRPGTIARLPLDAEFCLGTELFVTAWVKAAAYDSNSDDAGMLFTVMGVTEEGDGQKRYVPIYSHSTGQIRQSSYLKTDLPGTGGNTNEWFQVFFSFINETGQNFDHYVLQVDNNSASTYGGDMYLDEVKVYMCKPTAVVTQLTVNCDDERTRVRVSLDWNRLLARTGRGGHTGTDSIAFCFIDYTLYNKLMLGKDPADEAASRNALEKSLVTIGDGSETGEGETYGYAFTSMAYDLVYEKNTDYAGHPDPLAKNNMKNGRTYFYRDVDQGGRKVLAVDFYSNFKSHVHSYMMLINNEYTYPLGVEDFEGIHTVCSMNTQPFTINGLVALLMNGELVDPDLDYCERQNVKFTVEMKRKGVKKDENGNWVVDENTEVVIEEDVYYDWFLGTEEEFRHVYGDADGEAHQEHRGTSLELALAELREGNWGFAGDLKASSLEDLDKLDGRMSAENLSLLRYFLKDMVNGGNGGKYPRLTLCSSDLNLFLLKETDLAVRPIAFELKLDGVDDELVKTLFCSEPIFLLLLPSGEAPETHAGFENIRYPEVYEPALRIGLSQIRRADLASRDDGDMVWLKVNLRDTKLSSKEAQSVGLVTLTEGLNRLYLISSDDPAVSDLLAAPDFDQYAYAIGEIHDLQAKPVENNPNFDSYMEIAFDFSKQGGFQFNPREGYTYTFVVHFEEKDKDSEALPNVCYGNFLIDMKVVPEYLVWTGGRADNWNNDAFWKRADRDRLNKTGNGYPTNAENGDHVEGKGSGGFVPMAFSNVVMPEGGKAELYTGEYKFGIWHSNKPSYIGLPTENIQFDLMAYEPDEKTLVTGKYWVNVCNGLHFEPESELLHTERLDYRKAWTDVEVVPGQWNLLSVPLQGVYAGDWYVPSAGGREDAGYFTGIRFDEAKNNRLEPAVYQRSWDAETVRVVAEDGTGVPVTVSGNWSAVYNDVTVPYRPGTGFSLKASAVAKDSPLLFRMPKADDSYVYYDHSTTTGIQHNIPRLKAGRLKTDEMVVVGVPDAEGGRFGQLQPMVAELAPSADGGYYLVGNPFAAHLDVAVFLEANKELLEQQYWLMSAGQAEAGAKVPDADGWLTTSGNTLVAPIQAFYVKKRKDAPADEHTVTFESGMQKLGGEEEGLLAVQGLRLRVECDDGSASAIVAHSGAASDGFVVGEDAGLFRDAAVNGAYLPQVYTVAGDMASVVNQLQDAHLIPLGVFGESGKEWTLTFSGTGSLDVPVLYDAQQGTETPLYEGFTLRASGATHGRYFIRSQGWTATGIISGTDDIQPTFRAYSVVPGEIVLAATAAIDCFTVYAMDGHANVGRIVPGATVQKMGGLSGGIYVVKATVAGCEMVRKLAVK